MGSTKDTREYRRLARAEVRDAGGKADTIAVIDGLAVVYDSLSVDLGGFREKFLPGAFTEALKTADLRALVDHDTRLVLGRQSAGTLRIEDTDEALAVSIDVPDASYGRDTVVTVRRGDTDGMSFCFGALEDDWSVEADGTRIRTVSKALIHEVTITGFPAYEATRVALRSLDRWKATHEDDAGDDVRRIKLNLSAAASR